MPKSENDLSSTVRIKEEYLALKEKELNRREIALNRRETTLVCGNDNGLPLRLPNQDYVTIDQWHSSSPPCTPITVRYYDNASVPFNHEQLATGYDASTLYDRESFPCNHKPEPTWHNGYNSVSDPPPGFDYRSRSASENVNFEHPQSSNYSDRHEEYILDTHRTTTSEPRFGQSRGRQQPASSNCKGGSGQRNLQELVDALHLMTNHINRSQTHTLPQNKEDLFDGNPLRYRRFFRHSDSHNARGNVDMAVRLDR